MDTDALDPVIHAPARLRIVATLAALPDTDTLSFTRLQDMLDLTPGNLITHLRKLEDAGYLTSETTGNGRASRTQVALTRQGRAALDSYTATLRDLLDGLRTTNTPHSPGHFVALAGRASLAAPASRPRWRPPCDARQRARHQTPELNEQQGSAIVPLWSGARHASWIGAQRASGVAGKRTPKRSTRSGTLARVHLERVAFAELAEDQPGLRCVTPPSSTSSAKNRSKPAGAMISRIRQGSSPAFQKVCHSPRGLKHEVAGTGLEYVVAEERAHAAFEHVAVFVFAQVAVQRRGECVC